MKTTRRQFMKLWGAGAMALALPTKSTEASEGIGGHPVQHHGPWRFYDVYRSPLAISDQRQIEGQALLEARKLKLQWAFSISNLILYRREALCGFELRWEYIDQPLGGWTPPVVVVQTPSGEYWEERTSYYDSNTGRKLRPDERKRWRQLVSA